MTAGPSSPGGSVPPVPQFDYAATLVPPGDLDGLTRIPTSWYITHTLGRPAGGTYTEVAFAPDLPPQPEHVLEEVVRRVAHDLYGTAWAFTYRPDQYDHAIARHRMRRRELVVVIRLTVYGDEPQPPPSTYGVRPHRYPRTQAEADDMRRLAEQTSLLPPPDLTREDPRP